MENVLFKISFPAEFHAQTAAEAAVKLHPQVKDRLGDVERIVLTTQESAVRIISKTGPLHNPADRDHCLQYIVAVALVHGRIDGRSLRRPLAADPRLDALRARMVVNEDPRYTREYLEADKRSIANAVQVFFKDGSATDKVEVEYPLGHRRRRAEGLPLLLAKSRAALATRFPEKQADELVGLFLDRPRLEATPADVLMDKLVV